MWTPRPLLFCSGHGSVLGIGSPHGSEKSIPPSYKTMRKIGAIWYAVEEWILFQWKNRTIYLIKSIAIISLKLNKFVFSDGQSTTYVTYTDKIIIHTVLYSTVLYSDVILYFIILFSKYQQSIQNTMAMCIYGQYVYDTLTMYGVYL